MLKSQSGYYIKDTFIPDLANSPVSDNIFIKLFNESKAKNLEKTNRIPSYNISKDYNRLWDLITRGAKVVGWIHHKSKGLSYSILVEITADEDKIYTIVSGEFEYGFGISDDFQKECKRYKLDFIDILEG